MSTRKEQRRPIDRLPEERLPDVKHFMRALQADADGEPLSPETLTAMEEAWDNLKADNTVRLDFRREPGS